MVIQITPHAESPGVSGTASTGPEAKPSQKTQSKKEGLGVFAKILAGLENRGLLNQGSQGLLKKTGTGEAAEAEISLKVPLADKTKPGKANLVSGGKAAATAAESAGTEKNELKKSLKNGSAEPESLQHELSDQEKNIVLAVGLLTGHEDQQAEVSGKRTFKGLTADSQVSNRESVKTEATINEMAPGRELNSPEKQPLTTSSVAAGEQALNLKTANEKAKNRQNPLDPAAYDRITAGETGAHRTETKKSTGNEKDGGKLEDIRREKRRVSFEVRDFRSGPAVVENTARIGTETRAGGEINSKDIVIELRLPNQSQDPSAAKTGWEVKSGQAFEDLLARELHQNLNNDIVRHASVALRDGNEGTIRLALKPESLGNVKIHLEMAENKIIGQIVVESEEALRAFEREIASLEKAFRDSGFEGASLEMSLAADGGAEQQWQETEASHILPGQYAASRYDTAVEWMEPLILDIHQGARAVNVLV